MRKYVALVLIIVVLLVPCLLYASLMITGGEYGQGYALLKMVERSEVVVVGTVSHMNYVWREGILLEGEGMFTTDIVIHVETLIKGEPNVGDDHVRFMIQGGQGVHPDTNELLTLKVSTEPKFEVGDNVMVFLSDMSSGYYARYPYNRLHLLRSWYGKKRVWDNKVRFGYQQSDDSLIGIDLPLGLATNLAKAFILDKDATILLENQIKALAQPPSDDNVVLLSESLVTRLIAESKTIIDNAEEN